MGDVQVFVTRDAADFVEHVGGFLTSLPVEHNVLATVAATLEPTDASTAPLFGWVEAAGTGEISGAALRTPPRPLLASSMSADVADALMAKLLDADPELPGVTGPQPAAASLAEAWRRRTGGKVEPGMRQAIYWLAHVKDPPGRPAGRVRPAGGSDRDLMIEWTRAFSRDAGVPAADAETGMARRLRDERLLVWDDDRVVSMVGTSPPVAGVVRLGPVYTPPEARRHGYATALVAEVSRRALAAGATKCMLYTDLANPTSNHVYRAVGYHRSTDAQEYRFSMPSSTECHPGRMNVVRSTLALAVAACTVTACGGENQPPNAPLRSAVGPRAPAYRPGAAQASADIPYGGATRGRRATVGFVDDEPRTCRTDRRDRLLRFSLSVGPDRVGTGRSADKVRLRTGPLGTRAGQPGYEARILHHVVEIGGAGPPASGAGGSVRLAGDLRSGTVVIGEGDTRVTIMFRC